jgi:hypothetical protein
MSIGVSSGRLPAAAGLWWPSTRHHHLIRVDFGQLFIIFIRKLAIFTKGCVMEKETFVGKRVKFTVDAFWIGLVEGIVIKEFKNGKVAVQVERPNKVFHVKQTEVTLL